MGLVERRLVGEDEDEDELRLGDQSVVGKDK